MEEEIEYFAPVYPSRMPSAGYSFECVTKLVVFFFEFFFFFLGFSGSPTPSPYATALLPMGDQIAETIYSKPESVCPSRISYYASSQLTQVSFFLLNYHIFFHHFHKKNLIFWEYK